MYGSGQFYDSASLNNRVDEVEAGKFTDSKYNDLNLPVEALGLGATAPDKVAFVGGSEILAFDGLSTSEFVVGGFELLHDYEEGTDLHPHIHWSPLTADAGNVKWFLEYTIANVGDVFPSTTTISVIDATDATLHKNLAVAFPVIDGTGLKIGAQCRFKLYRNPADAEDTYAHDAGLITLGVHYLADAIGSVSEFVK